MILALIQKHSVQYPAYSSKERLEQLDMSQASYKRLRDRSQSRAIRQSVIPKTDVEETVKFILEHPDVGAGRAHFSLIDQERACVCSAFINEAKHEVARLAEHIYRHRSEQEKLLEAELRARREAKPKYENIQAQHPHHIWAIDFVTVQLFSFQLVICVVYDVYSQAYLALQVGTGCDQYLAKHSLEAAVAYADTESPILLRRDNGKAFETVSFQATLNGSQDAPIPPGQPWFNGSLESNNRSLTDAIKTTTILRMPFEQEAFHDARQNIDQAVGLLQQTCDQVHTKLNEEIARIKFGMPPANVLNGNTETTQERHQNFIQRKKEERKDRMENLKREPDRPPGGKTFIQKVRQTCTKLLNQRGTDYLYVINEVLHHRYQAVEI